MIILKWKVLVLTLNSQLGAYFTAISIQMQKYPSPLYIAIWIKIYEFSFLFLLSFFLLQQSLINFFPHPPTCKNDARDDNFFILIFILFFLIVRILFLLEIF